VCRHRVPPIRPREAERQFHPPVSGHDPRSARTIEGPYRASNGAEPVVDRITHQNHDRRTNQIVSHAGAAGRPPRSNPSKGAPTSDAPDFSTGRRTTSFHHSSCRTDGSSPPLGKLPPDDPRPQDPEPPVRARGRGTDAPSALRRSVAARRRAVVESTVRTFLVPTSEVTSRVRVAASWPATIRPRWPCRRTRDRLVSVDVSGTFPNGTVFLRQLWWNADGERLPATSLRPLATIGIGHPWRQPPVPGEGRRGGRIRLDRRLLHRLLALHERREVPTSSSGSSRFRIRQSPVAERAGAARADLVRK
jgi:hypothetical protein